MEKVLHRFRDMTKKCQLNGQQVIIAIQNQTSVDFAMAVRIMTEDALDYNMQCRMKHGEKLHKRDRLIPVITVVFYHGGTRLTGGWKEIFEVLQRQNSEKKMREYLTEKKEDHRNLPEDTKKLIFALLGKSEYYEEMTKKGEVAELCKAFEDHYKSGERKGRQEGEKNGIEKMRKMLECLRKENRLDEIGKALADASYLEKLLNEFVPVQSGR